MLCKFCQKDFLPKKNYQKFCSIECQEIFSKKDKISKNRSNNKKKCIFCQKEYEAYFYNSKKQKYCSPDCSLNHSRNPKNKREKNLKKICKHCNLEFCSSNISALFCNATCRINFHKKQWRQKTQENRDNKIFKCPICENIFTPNKTLRQIYCSKKCREKITKKIYKMLSTCYNSTNKENTIKELGYSPKQLLEHLQKFDNWNELKNKSWHLDHIFPIIAFVKKGIIDPSIICHLSNLQPLEGIENCIKNDTYDKIEFEEYIKKFNN